MIRMSSFSNTSEPFMVGKPLPLAAFPVTVLKFKETVRRNQSRPSQAFTPTGWHVHRDLLTTKSSILPMAAT